MTAHPSVDGDQVRLEELRETLGEDQAATDAHRGRGRGGAHRRHRPRSQRVGELEPTSGNFPLHGKPSGPHRRWHLVHVYAERRVELVVIVARKVSERIEDLQIAGSLRLPCVEPDRDETAGGVLPPGQLVRLCDAPAVIGDLMYRPTHGSAPYTTLTTPNQARNKGLRLRKTLVGSSHEPNHGHHVQSP